MNTIMLVVILISGYVYVNRSLSTRYQFKRSTGWDAYFLVAAWGTVFVVISWFICWLLGVSGILRFSANWLTNTLEMDSILFKKAFSFANSEGASGFGDLKLALWGLMSLGLAYCWGTIKKLWLKNENRRIDALVKAVGNNALEGLLIEASATQFPIIVTLKSRKFYVGFVHCPAFEHGTFDYLEILPLLSGYRDKDNLTVNVTTNYKEHYEKSGILKGRANLDLVDFRTLIPKPEIEGISFFDLDTYNSFKAVEDEQSKPKGLRERFKNITK
ncbi:MULTISPECIES: hypothetical protein [Pectobacterium]|uniref:hypothetical protein n=1 Tax=Pectobacterium TaxID=122277 RepID=UPI001968FF9A|nr:hypothetical protein [Pectobacterium brasiliense]MBN3043261.1 hypothetical protein [Pectobacterium brasiliense]WJM82346.1 hypothetical protein QTI90_06260 [Pectobacterium brasiliense]